jgi:hypothetical protein
MIGCRRSTSATGKWVRIPAAGAVGEVGGEEGSRGMIPGPDGPVYLAVSLRNVGNGIAVMHGWHFYPDWHPDGEHAPLEDFERQNRDLYIPVGDIGFWCIAGSPYCRANTRVRWIRRGRRPNQR